uniref:Uncharacterized protein n=1 Tax=Cannabis sativa TaxID=3483 RepID=A0A803P6Y6_CANSA
MAEADRFTEEVNLAEELIQEAGSVESAVVANSSHWEMDQYKNKLCNFLILWSYEENVGLRRLGARRTLSSDRTFLSGATSHISTMK